MNEALEIIKRADFKPDTQRKKVFAKLKEIISDKTENFQFPENISSTKIDMSSVIEERGVDKQRYITEFKSMKRSEKDAVLYLAENLKSFGNSDKDKKAKMFKLKMKMAKAKMKL
jgi:hypothetical protein